MHFASMKQWLSFMGLACLVAPGLHAAEDVDGAGDHPLVPRLADSWVFTFQRSEFDRKSIPTGPWADDGFESVETVEGEYLEFTYRFEDGDITTLRVKSNYRRMLEEAGFEILYAASNDELAYRDGVGFLLQGDFDRPDRRCCSASNSSDVRYLAARHPEEGVLMSMVTFEAQLGMGTVALVDVVTPEAMDFATEHQPLTTDEMESGLVQDGRVAVRNIRFAFDSDEILPESADALQTIADLMREQPELRLLVVGHTDNVGDFDYNLRLSMERATAVVEHLDGELGIDRDRLQSAGAGMMAPVTTNRTEEGRTENRRVELVELGS